MTSAPGLSAVGLNPLAIIAATPARRSRSPTGKDYRGGRVPPGRPDQAKPR